MKKPRFEVYPDKKGEWRWRYRSRNSRLIAESGEGYTKKSGAERGLRSLCQAIYGDAPKWVKPDGPEGDIWGGIILDEPKKKRDNRRYLMVRPALYGRRGAVERHQHIVEVWYLESAK